MTVPPELLDLCRRFEGLRLTVYRCPAGIPTIGYGHTGPEVRMDGPPITPALAEHWLQEDCARACADALRLAPALAAAGSRRLAAVADFIFNLGAGRFAASTLRQRILADDWDGAAEQLQRWVWAGGRRLPGLVLRRAAEARLMVPQTPQMPVQNSATITRGSL